MPVDVNLDNNDYSIYAETGDMPQRFEGIPVRINEMRMSLTESPIRATPSTADDKPFLSNPRSCTTTLDVTADITSRRRQLVNVTAPLAGPFTGCSNLNLDDNSVMIENVNKDAEQPTALNVEVTQGTAATQATMKDFSIDLPGFRLNAPAANGLVACSAAQLDAENCPANSRSVSPGSTPSCCRRPRSTPTTAATRTSTRCGARSTSRLRAPLRTARTATSWRSSSPAAR